jgi:hypothetical protein
MKVRHKYPLETAAAKAGMCSKTAKKYLKLGQLPSACKIDREHRTRIDPFANHWEEVAKMLDEAPELQAKTLLYYLIERYPDTYDEGHLRTLQRRVKNYRASHGKDREIIFRQKILPGQSSQSDWTEMNSLRVTICGQPFDHTLFHFMLPYSHWESVMICQGGESFDSLTQGFEKATFELGGTLPCHRTDNLSAATRRAGGNRVFTEKWQSFLAHYSVQPTRNNPGRSHENGSVEKSHDTLKNAIRQHLLLRGSRDFASLAEYQGFLDVIIERRNHGRRERLSEELEGLQELPDRRWRDPVSFTAKVSTSSTIQILGCTYSVPSRLISYTLKVDVYPDKIELCYGSKRLVTMPRLEAGVQVDYRHIVDSLVRKPGAFASYQYREHLFPRSIFRWAYDELSEAMPTKGHIHYLKILQLAKCHGECNVAAALQLCQEYHQLPDSETISQHLQAPILPKIDVTIPLPNLADYDKLYQWGGASC